MDIKIITCHDVYNYGASLQAFALQNYIQSLNNQCSIIDYLPWYLYESHKFWGASGPWNNNLITKIIYNMLKLPYKLGLQKRKNKFKVFNKKYLNITKDRYYKSEELKHCFCDVLVCGSDQIWNPKFENGKDSAFFGEYTNYKYLMSYAASIVVDIPKSSEEFFKEKLSKFNSISVRENSGKSELERLDIKNVATCIDPVYLLNKEEWIDNLDLKYKNEKYLLIYMFEDTKDIKLENQKIIEYIAKKLNLKIYSVNSRYCSYADKDFYQSGPKEFLELLLNASLVITNSFHGLSFSLIFQKNFWIIKREGLNSRLSNMMNSVEIYNRNITEDNIYSIDFNNKIDYSVVIPLLNDKITESKKYLEENLKNAK